MKNTKPANESILLLAIVECPAHSDATPQSKSPRINVHNYNNNYDRIFRKKAEQTS